MKHIHLKGIPYKEDAFNVYLVGPDRKLYCWEELKASSKNTEFLVKEITKGKRLKFGNIQIVTISNPNIQ